MSQIGRRATGACTLLAVLCLPVTDAVTSLPVRWGSQAALHACDASFSLAMRSLRLRRGKPGAATVPEAAAPLCDWVQCCALPSMAAPFVSCCTDLGPCHVSLPVFGWPGGAALLVALPADIPHKITDSEASRCHDRQHGTAVESAQFAPIAYRGADSPALKSLCYDVSGMIVLIALTITLASNVQHCIIASYNMQTLAFESTKSCTGAHSHLQALADPGAHLGGLAPVLMLPPGRLCASALAAAVCCSPVAAWTGAGLHLTS